MPTTESVADFLARQAQPGLSLFGQREAAKAGFFRTYDVAHFCAQDLPHGRRDFYKISLLTGPGQLHYAARSIVLDQPALVFSNPLVPYAWEGDPAQQGGYFCLFTEDFLHRHAHQGLQTSALFQVGSDPVFFPGPAALATLRHLFAQLVREQDSAYPHKHDLLRTYVHLLLHEARKLQPQGTYVAPPNAASRLVSLFSELLERQFPIEAASQPLALRTAQDYAACLSVHVNHLNHVLREATGKTTSAHLAARLTSEAKRLLRHTDWPVAAIAHALGFAYPTHFHNFFKKQTGLPPTALRA